MKPASETTLEDLDELLRLMLPEEYQDSYDDVQPVSMGSAGLRFDGEGRVAWDRMWASFCDLAMAGGPPHKGTLLEAPAADGARVEPERYREVVDEICRGVEMVTGLDADPSTAFGWIAVKCHDETMAGWLLRAIVMENIAVRARGLYLYLPAVPAFRLEKEIKNVVTVMAKTCHYWLGHMRSRQQREIGQRLADMATRSPLITPGSTEDGIAEKELGEATARMAARFSSGPALRPAGPGYAGWLGLQCSSVRLAVWMIRALVVCNVLARRESDVLFVPVNPQQDPTGDRVVDTLLHTHQLAIEAGVA